MVVSGFIAPPDDLVETTGEIIDVERGRDRDGQTTYRSVFAYEVDGREYTAVSSGRTSVRPTIGESVTIGYPEDDPAGGRRTDGVEGNFHRIFFWAGALAFVTSLGSLVVSIALIVVGIKLFRDGRRDRRDAGSSQGLMADLTSIFRQKNQLDPDQTAAGVPGVSQGPVGGGMPGGAPGASQGMMGGGLLGSVAGIAYGGDVPEQNPVAAPATQPAPSSPPPAAGPPAGWYPDPYGQASHRWWSGTEWTDHTS